MYNRAKAEGCEPENLVRRLAIGKALQTVQRIRLRGYVHLSGGIPYSHLGGSTVQGFGKKNLNDLGKYIRIS